MLLAPVLRGVTLSQPMFSGGYDIHKRLEAEQLCRSPY